MVFTGNANPKLAEAVAQHLNISLGRATVGRFSDGEVMVELLENVRGKDVFVLQSTCVPTNDNLMEVMVMVERLMREKKISDAPVYVDGMLWDVTAIHTAYPEYLGRNLRQQIFQKETNPFLSPIFKQIGSNKERQQVMLEEGSCLILATSGMLAGGPSVEYLKGLAEDKRHSLVFSCYQPPGSLGYRIRDGEQEIRINDGAKPIILQIKLEVHKVEITNHSDRRQLMNFVRRCNPQPKKIIVVHGEASRCLDLASSIHKQNRIETVAPKNLEVIRLR